MGVKPRRHLFLRCTLTRSSTASPVRSHRTDTQRASAQWTYSNTLLFQSFSLLNLSEFFKGTGNFMTLQGSQEGK